MNRPIHPKTTASLEADLATLDRMAHEGQARRPPASTIAEIVRMARTGRAWKQEALASFAGTSLSTVERVERGAPVSRRSLERIGTVLGYPVGAFTEPRVPLTTEAAFARVEEFARELEDYVAVQVRPLRGHRQIAALARTHLMRVDVTHLGPEWRDDAAALWEWLDLASFLLSAEEPDSIVDLGPREPTRRRQLYGSILDCVRGIERRAGAIALAGTYDATTGLPDTATVPVALVAFFPTATDPGAITRRTLLTPGSVDLAAAWRAMRETEEERPDTA